MTEDNLPEAIDPAEGAHALGRQVDIPDDPVLFGIDTVVNQHTNRYYIARFTIPEFTSLCPKTGQPDYATIFIDYVPYERLIESKSLKLYMFSFRNHGAFHEDCINMILQKLAGACMPYWMRVVGVFNPRGGIPIDVVCQTGKLPEPICREDLLPLGYKPFLGR